jgi:protein-arginine kinase activator protein McsA
MKCFFCENEATQQVTMQQHGSILKEVPVCHACAERIAQEAMSDAFPLIMLPLLAMSEMVKQKFLQEQTDKLASENCPECYELFRTFMLPMIKSIHKTYHVPRLKKQINKVEEIRLRLNKAIKEERFEDAVKLRDEMHSLEKERENPEISK